MKRIPLVVSGLSLAAGLVLGGGLLPAGAATAAASNSTDSVTSAGEPLNCSTSSSDPAQATVCKRAKDAGLTHQTTVVFPEFWGSGWMDVCKYGGSVRVAYAPSTNRAMVLGITSKLWAPSTGFQCADLRTGEVTAGSPLAIPQKIDKVIQDGVYRWATTAQPISGDFGVTVKMWWNDSLGGESRSATISLAS